MGRAMTRRITIMKRIISGAVVTGALLFATALYSAAGADAALRAAAQIIERGI